jgi:hypothetical protein
MSRRALRRRADVELVVVWNGVHANDNRDLLLVPNLPLPRFPTTLERSVQDRRKVGRQGPDRRRGAQSS